MKIRTKAKDVVWSYLGIFFSYGSSFLLLPFTLVYLDGEILGLWQVFLSIGSFVNILDFGFKPTLARNLVYAWSGAKDLKKNGTNDATGDSVNAKLFADVVAICKRIYLILALVATIILATAGTVYVISISKAIESNVYILAWSVYVLSVFTNLLFSYYGSMLLGVGRVKESNISTVISSSIRIGTSITLLMLGFGIIGMATGYLLGGLSYRIIAKFFFNRNTKGIIDLSNGTIEKKEFRRLFDIVWFNARKDGLVTVSTYLSGHATTLICSAYLSLEDTGIYSITVQLVTALAAVAATFYSANQPALQSALVCDDKDSAKKIMEKVLSLFYIAYCGGVIILVTVGVPILHIFKPDTMFSIPIILLFSLYEGIYKRHSLYTSFISNSNEVPYCKSYFITSFAGVLVCFAVLYFTSDLAFMICMLILVQLSYNTWKWPSIALKKLGCSEGSLVKRGILDWAKFIREKARRRI